MAKKKFTFRKQANGQNLRKLARETYHSLSHLVLILCKNLPLSEKECVAEKPSKNGLRMHKNTLVSRDLNYLGQNMDNSRTSN